LRDFLEGLSPNIAESPWNPTLELRSGQAVSQRRAKHGAPISWVGKREIKIKTKTNVKGSGQECPLHTALPPPVYNCALLRSRNESGEKLQTE
jgi:hypothetical protein